MKSVVKRMIILKTIFTLMLVLLVSGTRSLIVPRVVIDGYTVNSTLTSPATLPLGTTIILVCRVSGIPHGLQSQTHYNWTCPNEPCEQPGYAGRKINNNFISINITSASDGGNYTCNVTAAEEWEASKQFQLSVAGGQVIHSYGRLIYNERVITHQQQLQPLNNDSGDGRIECRVSSGEARFIFLGYTVSNDTSQDIHEIREGADATVVIRDGAFNSFVNFEGICPDSEPDVYHYVLLSDGTQALPNVSIAGATSTDTSINVNIGTIPSGIERVIIGYHRLDLGVPVVGKYVNNIERSSRTFSSLVPGAKYRITALGLGGSDDKRRSQSPSTREVTTMEQSPSPPRDLTWTRVFDDGIELNWIPPSEPNGDIRHYILGYTSLNGTRKVIINTKNNINYYNVTGLERGQIYNNISVVAVNSAGGGGGSQPIASYVHNFTIMNNHASCPPRVPSLPLNTMVLTTLTTTVPPGTTITIGCVDGYYTDREEILTCGSDGQWRGNITQCRGTPCTSYNIIPVIVGPIVGSTVILVVSITLLVIAVILFVKRKRYSIRTVKFTSKESKPEGHIEGYDYVVAEGHIEGFDYDEVDDYQLPVIANINAEAPYVDVNANKMDDETSLGYVIP